MSYFFPTAETWIAQHSFEEYVAKYGEMLDDMLWSDRHKEAFGHRPREPWHYPDPDKIDQARDMLSARLNQKFDMERRLYLANQYKVEKWIARAMQRNGCSYYEALCRIMADHDCSHDGPNGPRGGSYDEGKFCYDLGLDFGLKDMFRSILKLEIPSAYARV